MWWEVGGSTAGLGEKQDEANGKTKSLHYGTKEKEIYGKWHQIQEISCHEIQPSIVLGKDKKLKPHSYLVSRPLHSHSLIRLACSSFYCSRDSRQLRLWRPNTQSESKNFAMQWVRLRILPNVTLKSTLTKMSKSCIYPDDLRPIKTVTWPKPCPSLSPGRLSEVYGGNSSRCSAHLMSTSSTDV